MSHTASPDITQVRTAELHVPPARITHPGLFSSKNLKLIKPVNPTSCLWKTQKTEKNY